jgi:hypothetical protein
VLTKWVAGNHFSRPHFHPNDRFITAMSGTWRAGSSPNFGPNTTEPMPAGTLVTHFGKQVHHDGAKDTDAVPDCRRRAGDSDVVRRAAYYPLSL